MASFGSATSTGLNAVPATVTTDIGSVSDDTWKVTSSPAPSAVP